MKYIDLYFLGVKLGQYQDFEHYDSIEYYNFFKPCDFLMKKCNLKYIEGYDFGLEISLSDGRSQINIYGEEQLPNLDSIPIDILEVLNAIKNGEQK
jgi:hypothetical protein